jgi:DNA-binding NarL/FixJ family response regulator
MNGATSPLGPGVLSMLGVSSDELAVYSLLIEESPLSDEELRCRWLGTAPLASVLSRLVSAGLVSRISEGPDTYQANDPASIFGAHVQEQVRCFQQAVAALGAIDKQCRVDGGSDSPAAMAELVRGEFAVGQVIERAQRDVKDKVRCIGRLPHQSLERRDAVHLELLGRGVECRVVYGLSALRLDGSSLDAIANLNSAGQRSRVLPTTPIDIYLVDDQYALVAETASFPECDEIRIVRSGALFDAFAELFENLWKRAVPQEVLSMDGEAGQRGPCEKEDRRILGLLLTGLTDAAIARQLGLSPRTVQRRVASMLKRFGVHTRFQLGVQVALHEDQLIPAPEPRRPRP